MSVAKAMYGSFRTAVFKLDLLQNHLEGLLRHRPMGSGFISSGPEKHLCVCISDKFPRAASGAGRGTPLENRRTEDMVLLKCTRPVMHFGDGSS